MAEPTPRLWCREERKQKQSHHEDRDDDQQCNAGQGELQIDDRWLLQCSVFELLPVSS